MTTALGLLIAAGCGRLQFDAARDDGGELAASSDAGSAIRCGSVDVLAEDFQSATTSSVWNTYANNGASIAQGGGELVATMPVSGGNDAYAGYSSHHRMDLHDVRMYAHVTQVLSLTSQGVTRFQATPDIDNSVSIVERANQLYAFVEVAGVQQTIAVIPYDPTAHAWWQLREAQGTMYFETSIDGDIYTPFASTSTPAFADSVRIDLSAGTNQAETNPGAAHFAALNGGIATGHRCAAAALHDDFNSGVIGSLWGNAYTGTGATYSETGGHVTFMVPAAQSVSVLDSSMAYDLRESSVFAQVSGVPTVTGSYAMLRARTGTSDLLLEELQGTLKCVRTVAGVQTALCQQPYDATAHKFWRLRGTAGVTFWETSADGTQWTVLASEVSQVPLDAVGLAIGAASGSSSVAADAAVFETFNQLPP